MARILWALLLLSACVEASITAAWKIPIEHFAPDYKANDKIRKLEKPPGDSDFIQPGDELWDLSKALYYEIPSPDSEDKPFSEQTKIKLDQPWYGEWLVWNARSGMVVARGSWNDLFATQKLIRFDEAPITIRTRVELVTGGKDTVTVSLSGANGLETSAKENGLEVDVMATNMGALGLVDGRFHVSWAAAEKDSRWGVNANGTLKEGVRTKLARSGLGPNLWEVFATASREFSNGVKASEARLMEGPNGVAVWNGAPEGDLKKEPLGERLLVASYTSLFKFSTVARFELNSEKLTRIDAPADRSEWVRGRVIDLGPIFRGYGAELGEPGTLVVYDPGSDRYTVVGTAKGQDLCEQLIRYPGIVDPFDFRNLWIETDPEAGGWGLNCRSGEKASIEKTSPAGNRLSFEIEPMIGVGERNVDLRYEFDVFSKGVPAGQVKSSTTLELGKPQEIAGHSADGKEEKVILTVSEN